MIGISAMTLRDDLALPNGAGLVGFIQAGTGANPRRALDKLQETVSFRDFGAVGDDVADDTAAIQACFDYMKTRGGRIVDTGGVYRVSQVDLTYSASVPLQIIGAGDGIRKLAGTSTPVFKIVGTGVLDVYLDLFGFSVDHPGGAGVVLQIIDAARIRMERVGAVNGTIGLDLQGGLTLEAVKCRFNGNAIGVKARKSATLMHPNMLKFDRTEMRGNSQWGLDYDDGEGLVVAGCEVAANGETGNIATGGVKIGAATGSENGYGWANIRESYFEVNNGTALLVEDAPGLSIKVEDTGLLATEAVGGVKHAATVGEVMNVTFKDVLCGASGDTVSIAAGYSRVEGGVIHTLVDNSTHFAHDTQTSEGYKKTFKAPFQRVKLSTQDALFGRADQIYATGVADDVAHYLYGTGHHRFLSGGVLQDSIGANVRGFFGATPVTKRVVTGDLTGVEDPAAEEVIRSLLKALSDYGLVINSTT